MKEGLLKVIVLGTGTSTGVPVPGCQCAVCLSTDQKNKRLRTSVAIQVEQGPSKVFTVLIDTSPDLRSQTLRADIRAVDAVLYTHAHADHIFGIDDLRSFNYINKSTIPIYASNDTATELERVFRYAFFPDADYQGGAPPRLSLHRISGLAPFTVGPLEFLPLPVVHGQMEVFGYRVGNFAYITDCSSIPKQTLEHLKGLKVLILDGLRQRPHPTHLTHQQAVEIVNLLNPESCYLIHITHEVDHVASNQKLKQLTNSNVQLAYDQLVITV